VVDSVGVTGVEPSTATLPTLGSMLTSVALVDDHVRLTLAPGFTVVGDAFNVIVGCPVGAGIVWAGGTEATCFLQPPTIATTPTKDNDRSIAEFRKLPLCIQSLLKRWCMGLCQFQRESRFKSSLRSMVALAHVRLIVYLRFIALR
jgi:hypothetical protein